jgi:hypothetical protein
MRSGTRAAQKLASVCGCASARTLLCSGAPAATAVRVARLLLPCLARHERQVCGAGRRRGKRSAAALRGRLLCRPRHGVRRPGKHVARATRCALRRGIYACCSPARTRACGLSWCPRGTPESGAGGEPTRTSIPRPRPPRGVCSRRATAAAAQQGAAAASRGASAGWQAMCQLRLLWHARTHAVQTILVPSAGGGRRRRLTLARECVWALNLLLHLNGTASSPSSVPAAASSSAGGEWTQTAAAGTRSAVLRCTCRAAPLSVVAGHRRRAALGATALRSAGVLGCHRGG